MGAVLAAPDLSDPRIGQSSGGLQFIVEQVMWGPFGKIFLMCIVVAVSVCSLAVHTAAIRISFAMARGRERFHAVIWCGLTARSIGSARTRFAD